MYVTERQYGAISLLTLVLPPVNRQIMVCLDDSPVSINALTIIDLQLPDKTGFESKVLSFIHKSCSAFTHDRY